MVRQTHELPVDDGWELSKELPVDILRMLLAHHIWSAARVPIIQ
jgi:hypothetical protein